MKFWWCCLKILFCLTSVSFLTTACTLFGSQSGLEDPGFRQRATPATQAVPLPVEIAKDIERITEEGLVIYTENPSYSQAFGQFAKQVGRSSGYTGDSRTLVQDGVLTDMLGENIQTTGPVSDSLSNEDSLTDQQSEGSEKTAANNEANDEVSALSEDDFLIKQDGPLAKTMVRKKRGPLNFKSQLEGSSLPELKGGKTVNYIVRLGDTLMKIAFEKYANYLRWKDIYKINKDKMKSPERMQVGTELTIKNVKYIYIKRDGKPYLIRKMDTLKSISEKLYGTQDRWKDIWKNNPELIRNPKKIYAGFTLYYPADKAPQEVLPEVREPTSDLPKELPLKQDDSE